MCYIPVFYSRVIIGLHQNLYKQLPKDPTCLYGNGYKKIIRICGQIQSR